MVVRLGTSTLQNTSRPVPLFPSNPTAVGVSLSDCRPGQRSMMVEKRKRYVAVRESTQAKRRSTSPTGATTTPEVPTRSLTPDVPSSFARDGPLPVVPKHQVDGLLLREYKSVAESKVMAESLVRSQRKWVDGDIFEKFWTKPLKSRKLDPVELEKNPSRDCMTKLGNCTLSCKPHRFEIRLFGVLEPVKIPQAVPVQRPPLQVQSQATAPTAPIGMAQRPQYINNPHPNPGPQAALIPQPVTAYGPPQQPTLPQASAAPSQVQGPPRQLPPSGLIPPPTFIPNAPPPSPQPGYHPQPGNQHVGNPGPPQHMVQQGQPQNMVHQLPPRPDPVIQSLAVRAASDPELKALMRIVASGKATTEQLKIFQGHIDALTPATSPPIVPIVGRPRPLVPQGPSGVSVPAHPQAVPQSMHPQYQPHPQHLQHQNHPQHLQHQQHPHRPQYTQQYPQQHPQQVAYRPAQYSPPQVPQKPRPFPQPPKQEITSVVFEFVDPYSQGDRFVFPKYTILEYLRNGTMVKASFIVTRKPVDDLDEYYQPVTITLESLSPRTLEILQKVVADQETTCTYMKHLMQTRKRAEDSFLVFRLRRDPNEAVPEKSEKLDMHDRIVLQPQKAIRESRVKRDTSTPARDSKSSADHTPQPAPSSRPRVKTVKKALPKEQPRVSTPNTNDEPSSSIIPTTPIPRPPKQPKPPRSRKGRIADPTKSCSLCNTSKTSLWRKADINGENVTVCNACGIKWKTSTQRAAQVATAHATGQPLPGMDSRENSSSGGVRPTAQQLASGEPQMHFPPFAQESNGFASQNNGGQPVYPTAEGVVPGGQVYQQPFPGYQGPHQASTPEQQQVPANNIQQAQNHSHGAAVPASQYPSVEEQKENQFSAASLIVASHVAAHQPQPSAPILTPTSVPAPVPVPGSQNRGTVPEGS